MDKAGTPQKTAPTKIDLTRDTTKVAFEVPKSSSKEMIIMVAGVFLVIMVGIGIGFMLSKQPVGATLSAVTGGKIVKSDKVVGSLDETAYPDSTEGQLEKGGIEGEGTHQLLREGGPTKTAYLTSSVIDLNQFVGKKVKVWGETRAAQKAGWLLDVGRLEILE